MTLDQQLREMLAGVAEGHEPPDPDLGALVAGGQRERRQRDARRVVGIAIALVVLAVGWVGVRLFGGEPEPAEQAGSVDLPLGAPPQLPYCIAGTALVDGREVPCGTLVARSATAITSDGDSVFELRRDGTLRRLSYLPPFDRVPMLDGDGRYGAWVTEDARLLVWDLVAEEPVASVPVPTAAGRTAGIDARHRVFFQEFTTARIWMYDIPAGRLVEVTGVPGTTGRIRYVTADGFGVDRGRFHDEQAIGRSLLGSVDDRGRFLAEGEVPIGWSSWSPDFSRFVQETRDGWWVQSADLSERVVLDFPDGGLPTANPVWEDEDSLLVTFDPSPIADHTLDLPSQGWGISSEETYVLRCSARNGSCEIALLPGWGAGYAGPAFL